MRISIFAFHPRLTASGSCKQCRTIARFLQDVKEREREKKEEKEKKERKQRTLLLFFSFFFFFFERSARHLCHVVYSFVAIIHPLVNTKNLT